MAIDFSKVTKIIGPGGKEVSKITRTNDGVVLWNGKGTCFVTTDGKLANGLTIEWGDEDKDTNYYKENVTEVSSNENRYLLIYLGGAGGYGHKAYFPTLTDSKFIGKTIHIDEMIIWVTTTTDYSCNGFWNCSVNFINSAGTYIYNRYADDTASSAESVVGNGCMFLGVDSYKTAASKMTRIMEATNIEYTIPSTFESGKKTYNTANISQISTFSYERSTKIFIRGMYIK